MLLKMKSTKVQNPRCKHAFCVLLLYTEGQESGESRSNLGLISGVTVAGLLVVVVLLTVVVFCALKFRACSKSGNLSASISAGFGKIITYCPDTNHMQI